MKLELKKLRERNMNKKRTRLKSFRKWVVEGGLKTDTEIQL